MATEKLHIVSDNIKYRRTAAERSAGVSSVSHVYDTTDYGDMRRYGLPIDGASTCTAALNSALAVAEAAASIGGNPHLELVFPRGTFVFATKPNDIVCPVHIRGPSARTAVLVRDYTPAAASDGLFNLRAGASTAPIGCKIFNLTMGTGSGRTGGCLISAVQPSSGDGADGLLLDNLRLTNSVGLGGTGNGPDYQIYLDGSARASPLGLRGVTLRNCEIFGAAVRAMYCKTVVSLTSNGGFYLSAGSLSGQVEITGGGVGSESYYVSFNGGQVYGFVLDYVSLLVAVVAEINGAVSSTANTDRAIVIDASGGVETLLTRSGAGGNIVTTRLNASNPRGGLYIGGSSGQPFVGSNLTHSSGNTFNFDKNGAAWFIGDPTLAGNLAIGASTGTAGNAAGVGDLSAALLTFVPGVAAHTKSYTVGTLPSAALAGGVIYVSNEAGGAVLAFSDGTNWRRVTDRAIVS